MVDDKMSWQLPVLLHIRGITSGFQLSPVSLLRAFELRGLCFTLEISVEIPWGLKG